MVRGQKKECKVYVKVSTIIKLLIIRSRLFVPFRHPSSKSSKTYNNWRRDSVVKGL